ncbi:uncharacterized protein LOC115671633, partial [Syzygium oleosum]|uniref:uncharacterized protein LOC115671633 n=1 Tax=Syzygium oleosum TaxID=219896 RepID=UPI0011D2888C
RLDASASDMEHVHEEIGDEKRAPSIHCDLYDTEISRKIAQMLLPGLATACVDNTTGDIFRTPALVAVDLRKEFVEYLTQRSESFVAETAILEGDLAAEASDDPYEIVADFADDFATLKMNLFGRISGWLLSEKREDKIDDIVQEMELSKFWAIDRREAIARTLLKNVDFKGAFHCVMKFHTAEDLAEHVASCGFRSMICTNEGCNTRFTAAHLEKHDLACPFKIIPCEQNCSESLMRRDMDRHCITNCPMKLMKCPFYQVGCQSTVPQCTLEQHNHDNLHDHVLHVLQRYRKDASADDLKRQAEQLELSFSGELALARDVKSLTLALKDLEARLPQPEAYMTSGPQPDAYTTTSDAEQTEVSSSARLNIDYES